MNWIFVTCYKIYVLRVSICINSRLYVSAHKQSRWVKCDGDNKPPLCRYSFKWELLGTRVKTRIHSAKKLRKLYKSKPYFRQSKGRIWTTTLSNKNKLVTWFNGHVLARPGLPSIKANQNEMDVVTVGENI